MGVSRFSKTKMFIFIKH